MNGYFLKKISRMLIFSIFVSGLPLNLQASDSMPPKAQPVATQGNSGSSNSTPATCPNNFNINAKNACTGYDTTGKSCNLSACLAPSSKNTPVFPTPVLTADKTWAGDSSPGTDPITAYVNGTDALVQAFRAYGFAYSNYQTIRTIYGSTLGVFSNFMPVYLPYAPAGTLTNDTNPPTTSQYGYTTGPDPLLPGSTTNIWSSGDFLPTVSNSAEKAALMLGYMNYIYSSNVNAGAQGNPLKVLQYFTTIALYGMLQTQLPSFNDYAYAQTVFSNQLQVYTYDNAQALGFGPDGNIPAVPYTCATQEFTPSLQAQYLAGKFTLLPPNSEDLLCVNGALPAGSTATSCLQILPGLPAPLQWTGGQPSTPNLNLLVALSNGQWSGVVPTDLYNIISNINPAQFNAQFPASASADNQALQSFLNTLLAINNGQMYFNCSRDYRNGQPIDASLYYAVNPTSTKISLADQWVASSVAIDSQTPPPLQLSMLPSNVATVFNYLSGNFYFWLGGSTSTTKGPIDLSGLNGTSADMQPGSQWASVCANSASVSALNTLSAVLDQFENISNSKSVGGNNTLQATQMNLLQQVQTALTQPPLSDLSLAASAVYDWATASYPAISINANQDSNNLCLSGNGQTVCPSTLSNFDGTDGSLPGNFIISGKTGGDHLNQIMDMIAARGAYFSCWSNISNCVNGQKASSTAMQDINTWMGQNPAVTMIAAIVLGPYIDKLLVGVLKTAVGSVLSLGGRDAMIKGLQSDAAEWWNNTFGKAKPANGGGSEEPVKPANDGPTPEEIAKAEATGKAQEATKIKEMEARATAEGEVLSGKSAQVTAEADRIKSAEESAEEEGDKEGEAEAEGEGEELDSELDIDVV